MDEASYIMIMRIADMMKNENKGECDEILGILLSFHDCFIGFLRFYNGKNLNIFEYIRVHYFLK